MALLILGLLLFLGVHSVRMIVPGLREVIKSAWGDGTWKGLYSMISIVGLVLIVFGYGAARMQTQFVYEPPIFGRSLATFLMIPSFILLAASQMPVGRIKVAVRHPMIIGVILWAFSHLLANGDVASLLLFGAFLLWSVINWLETFRRPTTDFGQVQLRFDAIAVVAGFGLYLVFALWLHEAWIGVAPLG